MSLILDALNKADREREPAPEVPSITAPYTAPVAPAHGALPSWVYALAGALAVTVVVMLILLFKLTGSATPPAVEPSQVKPVTAGQHPPAPLEVAAGADRPAEATTNRFGRYEMAPVSTTVEPRPVEPATPLNKPPAADTIANLYGQAATQVSAPERKKEQLAKAPEAKAPPKTKHSAANTQPLVSDAELAKLWQETQQETAPPQVPDASAGGKYQQLPYLHQLPESFQTRIPTLMYQNHIYTSRASAVIINGATYKVGDSLGDQLKIEAITEEDLVLSYMERPFKLAALSSWVQLD